MCNFYSRHRELTKLQAVFRFAEQQNDPPRYVVRPSDTERVVALGKDGERHAIPMRWGLVPYWAKDVKVGFTTFNYRSEDFTSKPAFKGGWERGRRCLVPCDGFFEFTGEKGSKQPWFFKPRDGGAMAFAGLWEQWKGPKDAPQDTPLAPPLLSFSIATTSPNATVAPIHDRMPVVFTREAEWNAWLDPKAVPEELRKLLAPAADGLLEVAPVSSDLLRVKEPTADILNPVVLT